MINPYDEIRKQVRKVAPFGVNTMKTYHKQCVEDESDGFREKWTEKSDDGTPKHSIKKIKAMDTPS